MNIHVWIHPGKTFSVTTQVNFSLSENFASLERAKLWTISCIRPNDSGSPNSFDKHRVISQIRSLLLPDLTARKTTDYVADYEMLESCERYYGAPYQSPNAPYDFGGPQNRGVFESDYDKKDPRSPGVGSLAYSARDTVKESGDMVVKEVPNAVVEIPSTKSGRYCQWLWVVWLTTWWIPNFMLQYIGRMKRPDIRLAWREKVTIFWLIFLFNALVIFYIVEFGRLLCPNFDKSWGSSEVAQHQGSNDYWVSVAGVVYDLSNFINGDHSNGYFGIASNSPDVLDALAGSDLTYYFPPPLISACTSGLVTDGSLSLTRKNFMDLEPLAQHVSGQLQTTVPDMKSNSWYTNTFLAKMKTMQKGPLVLTKQTLAANAADTTIAK